MSLYIYTLYILAEVLDGNCGACFAVFVTIEPDVPARLRTCKTPILLAVVVQTLSTIPIVEPTWRPVGQHNSDLEGLPFVSHCQRCCSLVGII